MHGDPKKNSILAPRDTGALGKEHISLKMLDGSSPAGGEHMSLDHPQLEIPEAASSPALQMHRELQKVSLKDVPHYSRFLSLHSKEGSEAQGTIG